MEVLASVKDLSKETIDSRMLKTNVLSIVIVAFVGLTVFLVYYMIKDYSECIMLAVLSSMALRPIKGWTLAKIQELSVSQPWFPTVARSWVCHSLRVLWGTVRGTRVPTDAEAPVKQWKSPDACWVSILTFAVYAGVVKLKPKTLVMILLVLLMADVVVRLAIDLFAIGTKMFGWGSAGKVHKAEACSSLLSLLILFCALFTTFALSVGLLIPTGLEIKDQSASVIAKVQGLGFNFTAESITLTVTKYLEQAGGLKSFVGIEDSIGAVFPANDTTVDAYVIKAQEIPMVGEQVKAGLLWVEGKLNTVGVPFHHVVEFVTDNINEISFYALQMSGVIWSVFISSATSLFSSFIDFVYCACLYLSLVFFLLTRESSVLFTILSIIPIGTEMQRKIEADLSTNVVQVFTTIIKVSITYTLSTYVLFDCLDLPLKHTAAVLTGLVGFVQILDPWMVTLPWVVSLMVSGMYTRGAVVLGVEYFVLGFFYTDIYSHTVTSLNVTILTLASVFGLSNFGVLGVLYGPLIAGLINVFIGAMKGLNTKT